MSILINNELTVKKSLIILLIISVLSFFAVSCKSDEDGGKVKPPQEFGIIGEKYEKEAKYESFKKRDDLVAIVGGDVKEIYKLKQFVEDAKIMMLSNMLPNEVVLKKDRTNFKTNLVWDVVSTKLLYREALNGFRIFSDEFKKTTFEILEQDAKTQFMLLKEINIPIKTYEPTLEDRKRFYKEREEVFLKQGITSYKNIVQFEEVFKDYYIRKVNERNIKRIIDKYEYELNDNIVYSISQIETIDGIMKSEYADKIILKIGGKEFTTAYFAKYLLVQLTNLTAKTYNTKLITEPEIAMGSIESIAQKFVRHHLLLLDFRTKKFDPYEQRRFVNIYLESRIADIMIRKEIDRAVPPPLGSEIDDFYKEREISVKNYFWSRYGEMALEMTEEELENHLKNIVAREVAHNENIAEEQRNYRNYILDKNDYWVNKDLLDKNIFKKTPFDAKNAKSPFKMLN